MTTPMTALELAVQAGAGPVTWVEPVTIPAELFFDVLDGLMERMTAKPLPHVEAYWRERLENCTSYRSLDYVPAPTWTELPLDPRR